MLKNNRELFKTMSDWDRWKYIKEHHSGKQMNPTTKKGVTARVNTRLYAIKKQRVVDYIRNLAPNTRIIVSDVMKATNVSRFDIDHIMLTDYYKGGNVCGIIIKNRSGRHKYEIYKA